MRTFFFLTFLIGCCINAEFQERHWTSPAMVATLQATINTPQSDRLKQMLKMTPRLLDVYFAISLRDVNDCMLILCFPVDWLSAFGKEVIALHLSFCSLRLFPCFAALICALIPLLMSRNDTMFPDKIFSYEVCSYLKVIGMFCFRCLQYWSALWLVKEQYYINKLME